MRIYNSTNGTQDIIQRPYEMFCIFEGTERTIELPPEPSLLENIAVKADN